MTEQKSLLFRKWDTTGIEIKDLGLQTHVSGDKVLSSTSNGQNKKSAKAKRQSSSGLPTFSRTVVLAGPAGASLLRADGIRCISPVYEGSYWDCENWFL